MLADQSKQAVEKHRMKSKQASEERRRRRCNETVLLTFIVAGILNVYYMYVINF